VYLHQGFAVRKRQPALAAGCLNTAVRPAFQAMTYPGTRVTALLKGANAKRYLGDIDVFYTSLAR
jgi:hypothetical protein